MYMLCTSVIFLYFKKFRIITFGIRAEGLGVSYIISEGTPRGILYIISKGTLGGYLVYESIH
jgi:hypothetical protein